MEELPAEMVLLERSSSTKLRVGISFWRCNSYQPRCCRGGLELYNFRQTRLPQKDILSYLQLFLLPLACDTLDLTVDNVAGPPLKLILILRDSTSPECATALFPRHVARSSRKYVLSFLLRCRLPICRIRTNHVGATNSPLRR